MQPKKLDRQLNFLCPDLLDQLYPRNHLLGLAKVIPWQLFEDNFLPLYAASSRLGKPARLMVELLILKQVEFLSDDRVVEAWVQGPYLQAFSGQERFTWKLPYDPSVLACFRRRSGEDGVRKIFEVSVTLHGDKAKEAGVAVDSTVQEKNIAFPTDAKLLTKIVMRCHAMAKLEDVKFRRCYQREIKSLLRAIRFKSKGRRQSESRRAVMRSRTVADILVHELKRKHCPDALNIHQQALDFSDRVQRQQRSGTDKIYSLRESGASCISKGKARKEYEFGAKASAALSSGVIVGALPFRDNPFDGHALPAVLSQVERIVGKRPVMVISGRGYRGKHKIGVASIEIPELGRRTKTASDKRQTRKRFRRREVIESIIDHLKNDHRMLRYYVRGQIGDSVNLFMACAAFNFRKFIQILCFFVPQIPWVCTSTRCAASKNLCLTWRFKSF